MTSFFKKLFHRATEPSVPAPKTDSSPLFIVGLGNPGKKYTNTRHNLGFLAVEHLQKVWGGSEWRLEKKFQAEISEAFSVGRKIFLVKPQTFMNHSGQSTRSLLDFYKATAADLIVLHDEVDIPFGKMKTTLSSRAAGHNGVKDIIERLGTQDFRRLRLGVGKSENPNVSVSDHVLAPFTNLEQSEQSKIFQTAEQHLKEWL